jgi:hypothetical protein
MDSLAQARKNQAVDYPEVLPEVGCFGFRHEKAGVEARLIQGKTMETKNSATRQHAKTVRIVTDLPVLVQSEHTLTRKGREKPLTLIHGPVLVLLSFTDSGEPMIKIVEPPS